MFVPNRSRLSLATGCILAALPCATQAWQPGIYPTPPARMASSGFAVDTSNRNDVVSFWHAVYQASEGYEKRIAWTGDYAGNNGTTSADFVNDVERRINYFRAMCGVPAIVKLNTGANVVIEAGDPHKPIANTTKTQAAQASAMLLIRNYNSTTGADPAINHDPPSSLTAWSNTAWNGNDRGNIAFGVYGPGAISEYLVEELASNSATSVWNTTVGHRRWIVFPPASDFATGDQPGDSAFRPPTNSLYVIQNAAELVPDPTPGFVAYPPPGFFPAPVNSRYWSFSLAKADFSKANVAVTDAAGKAVSLSNVQNDSSHGDPALVWEVGGAAAANDVYNDSTFNVKVTGVAVAGVTSNYSYSVTLINPDRITGNQSLTGSATPVAGQTTAYSFTRPPGAEGIQVTAFQRKYTAWTENAEDPATAQVIDRTADNYELMVDPATLAGFGRLSGTRSFRLTFPTVYDLVVRGVPEQSFEINRLVVPKTGATLQFLYRRGYMTVGSHLVAEISSDEGVTWKQVGSTISGVSNTKFDSVISSATFDLPKSTYPVTIRFRYFSDPVVAIYTQEGAPTSPTGIFLDNITVGNCDYLAPRKTNDIAASTSKFMFKNWTAGATLVQGSRWSLAMRTKLGGKWFPYGPMKFVTIAAP